MKWWREKYLDWILVPAGLLILFFYHLHLLYRCMRRPEDTTIGFENHCNKIWAQRMMQIAPESRGTAFSVISSNISAATFLASTSLALTSLIGTWVGSSSNNIALTKFIYGNKSVSVSSMKYVSVVAFFLVAFAAFIQSTRSYVQANFFLSMPQAEVPVKYVEDALSRGHNFWQLGLRAIYFATNLLMWVFGPIPMFVSSVATVVILHIIDANSKPLHGFPTPDKSNLKKLGEEVSEMAAMALHHDRPQGIQTTA